MDFHDSLIDVFRAVIVCILNFFGSAIRFFLRARIYIIQIMRLFDTSS